MTFVTFQIMYQLMPNISAEFTQNHHGCECYDGHQHAKTWSIPEGLALLHVPKCIQSREAHTVSSNEPKPRQSARSFAHSEQDDLPDQEHNNETDSIDCQCLLCWDLR